MVSMADDLVEMLRARHKRVPHAHLIFPNHQGEPQGHFLLAFHPTARVGDTAVSLSLPLKADGVLPLPLRFSQSLYVSVTLP